jgi:hypothetical protein
MATIEVDFQVFKELTVRRETEDMTPNDVIRDLLGLGLAVSNGSAPALDGWSYKGVLFPNGTEFKATHKGTLHTARVVSNRLMLDGKEMNSPSEAAMTITKSAVNGWTFWRCKFPDSKRWQRLSSLRSHD